MVRASGAQAAKPKEPAKSTSTALVPRRVIRKGGDDEDISRALVHKSGKPKPSTERAIALRKAMNGTGEVVLSSRIPGQEKLHLLAGKSFVDNLCFSHLITLTIEDLMKNALRAPFSLQTLQKMSESQMDCKHDSLFAWWHCATSLQYIGAKSKTCTIPTFSMTISS